MDKEEKSCGRNFKSNAMIHANMVATSTMITE